MKPSKAMFNQQTKCCQLQKEYTNRKKRVIDFVQSNRISEPKQEKPQEPLKVVPVTGQSQLGDGLDDGYFDIETKPEKIIRKKVSLDLDVVLHKRLKHIALENDAKLYELVEGVLQGLRKKTKIMMRDKR